MVQVVLLVQDVLELKKKYNFIYKKMLIKNLIPSRTTPGRPGDPAFPGDPGRPL